MLQQMGWPAADKNDTELISAVIGGIPSRWRNAMIRHLGRLPETYDECRKMLLRVYGEDQLIARYGTPSTSAMPPPQLSFRSPALSSALPTPPTTQPQVKLDPVEAMEIGYLNNYRGQSGYRFSRVWQSERLWNTTWNWQPKRI